jgi:carboxyl-terminal processing protease
MNTFLEAQRLLHRTYLYQPMYQDQNSPKKINVWLPLLFGLTLVVGMLIGMKMQKHDPILIVEADDLPAHMPGQGKIEEILRYIEAKYVDEVDRDELMQEVIDDLLAKLDPHSNYITAKELQQVNEQLQGNFNGIGVEFMMLDDTIVVVAPLAGGPSEAAGILAGDKIVAIGDSIIAGVNMDTQDVISMLRGEKGTEVEVGVLRNNSDKLIRFNIVRDKIPMNSVDISYMLDESTGYVKINRFSATTYEEFMQSVERMSENDQMEDLVIDLRHNPGGYLQQATSMLSQMFNSRGELLVYTEGRAVNRTEYESSGRTFYNLKNIVVLIDEGSASASEIVAGAIQDHDRGLIIGRRSFGKGLVQEQYKLRDGSALRLTVARYYTPSGRSIQKGYEDMEGYDQELSERFENGELEEKDKIAIVDSTQYFTDNGRVVYGGGGVVPDIFVPIDTILIDEDYLQLRQHIPQFVFRYMSGEGAGLKEYSLPNFLEQYQVADQLFDEFMAYSRAQGAELDRGKLSYNVQSELKRFIKARVAKHLFGDEGFYTFWNERDPVVKEALKALENPNPMTASQN